MLLYESLFCLFPLIGVFDGDPLTVIRLNNISRDERFQCIPSYYKERISGKLSNYQNPDFFYAIPFRQLGM